MPLWFGGERGTHVEAINHDLYAQEANAMPMGRNVKARIGRAASLVTRMGGLNPAVAHVLLAEHEAEGVELKTDAKEHQEREEEPACLRVRNARRPLRSAAASSWKTKALFRMSGSLEMTLGWLWWAPCFCSHQE